MNGTGTYTPARLAKMIDQTLLKAYATREDFEAFCRESDRYGFKMVAINSAPVKLCKTLLKDSDVLVGAAIGFPLGQTTLECKVKETELAIADGADEIDYVINIGRLRSGDTAYIEEEMRQMVRTCRAHEKTVKVIFENCYLTTEEKKTLCEIALRVRPDFIKTSTGFGTPASGVGTSERDRLAAVGAALEDVRLMKSIVGNKIKVKAAGGIRTLEDALAMLEAGAERLGTSAGVRIMEALPSLQHAKYMEVEEHER